ncbi:MAG: universal stress protein [bacterium]|nr:universal stress protein [bacterium]
MRYVLATDGSEASMKAARFLLENPCPGSEDEIFVVHVFPLPSDPEIYADVLSLPTSAGDDRVKRVAKPILEKTLGALAEAESQLHEVVLVGNPAEQIVQFATTMGAELIVVGTRSRSAANELYLGSVSSAVAHRALCSVLIVR